MNIFYLLFHNYMNTHTQNRYKQNTHKHIYRNQCKLMFHLECFFSSFHNQDYIEELFNYFMCIKISNKSLNFLLLSSDSFVNTTQKVLQTEKYFVIKITFLFYLLLRPFPIPYHPFFQ